MPWAVAGAAIGAVGSVAGSAISSGASSAGTSDAEAQYIQNAKIQANAQQGAADTLSVGAANANAQEVQATLQAQQFLQQYLAQAQGTAQQAGTQAEGFEQNAYNQAAGSLNPFVQGGSQAYQSLISQLPGLTAPMSMTQQQLEQTPGYQFQLSQGLEANQNQASARGLGISGAAIKGGDTFATGLANSTYQTQLQNYLAQNQQRYNILSGAAGIGAGAAQTLGGIAEGTGQGSANAALSSGLTAAQLQQLEGSGLAGLQSSYGSAAGQNIMNAAGASAGGQTGAANATASGGNAAANIGLQNSQNQGAILGQGATGLGSSISQYLTGIGNGTFNNPFGGSSSGEFSNGTTANSSINQVNQASGDAGFDGLLNQTG